MAKEYPRKPDGSIDWEQNRKDEVAKGDRCKNPVCDAYIINLGLFGNKVTHAQECGDCRTMNDDKKEVTHDNLLRCPKCGNKSAASEEWEAGIYDENEKANIYCVECDHEFEVETHCSYSFTSPPMIVEN